jgi:glycine/D-amino acid oxidase-like deaminating enzyme
VVPPRNQLGRTPTAGKHSEYDNVWLIGGLGSRGLLYHALLARLVIQAVVEVHNEKEALKVDVMERKKVSVD